VDEILANEKQKMVEDYTSGADGGI
jgi:hypothetical protein